MVIIMCHHIPPSRWQRNVAKQYVLGDYSFRHCWCHRPERHCHRWCRIQVAQKYIFTKQTSIFDPRTFFNIDFLLLIHIALHLQSPLPSEGETTSTVNNNAKTVFFRGVHVCFWREMCFIVQGCFFVGNQESVRLCSCRCATSTRTAMITRTNLLVPVKMTLRWCSL